MTQKVRSVLLVAFVALIAAGLFAFKDVIEDGLAPASGQDYSGIKITESEYEVVGSELHVPWEIGFLPNGDMLVTEFRGNLVRIRASGDFDEATAGANTDTATSAQAAMTRIPVAGVAQTGDAGLTGLLVHPDFAENNRIYLFMTGEDEANRVSSIVSFKLIDDTLTDPITIIEGIKGGDENNGGRIALGPDNLLYVTTGDSRDKVLAQDLNSLNGKILRVDPNGDAPETNPFQSKVYTYGHRNPLGITWTDDGAMWSVETGRTGEDAGLDEINRILQSNNYGWPEIEGDQDRADMTNPIKHSGPSTSWHPTSVQYYDGSLFFGGLNGDGLYEAVLNEQEDKVEKIHLHLKGQFGRIRTVTMGSDGKMYLLTSNKDGVGKPFKGDDRVIRLDPKVFRK